MVRRSLQHRQVENLGPKDLSEGSYYRLSCMTREPWRSDKDNVRAALDLFIAKTRAVERPIWTEAGLSPQQETCTRCLGSGLWIWLLVAWVCVMGMGGCVRKGPNGGGGEGVSMWLIMLDASRRNN
jgi:hypothetical protein